jgi:prolyl 4-hydroxylase
MVPRKGAALYFGYANSMGQSDPRTYHGAEPLGAGEKWIVTKWTRER